MRYPGGVKPPRISPREANSIPRATSKRGSKYGNQPVVIDDIKFDSKVEGAYYLHLKALKCEMKYHESFVIEKGFALENKHYSDRIYTPDFTVYSNGELSSVIDVKGGKATITEASRLRMVLFMARYHVPVVIATYDKDTGVFREEIK